MNWTFWKKAQPKTITIETPKRINIGDFVIDSSNNKYRIIEEAQHNLHFFTYTAQEYKQPIDERLMQWILKYRYVLVGIAIVEVSLSSFLMVVAKEISLLNICGFAVGFVGVVLLLFGLKEEWKV